VPTIETIGLSKRYGEKLAVDNISFGVEAGKITGFLGPNGAGKSTTMRLLLGLDKPTHGQALINGKPYAKLERPLATVGALLEARAIHTGRSARNHLLSIAATSGIGAGRVDQVLDMVGLADVANKRAGNFSLGMGQRLGIASALLADPEILILDEPINGLDPDGIRWIRTLLKSLAAEGRTVFLSSHLMSEMSVTADHVIVIGRGKLLRDESMANFLAAESTGTVQVSTPQFDALTEILRNNGGDVTVDENNRLSVKGLEAAKIGELAFHGNIVLHELTPEVASLEEAYMKITEGALDFHAESPHKEDV